ncbi:MAG TPA: ABC transporter substrate-binding protein, partial [Nitrolancea sp.]|nr:ABC transporter substrate-binding protein [Nitrolancea sp.]
MNQDPRYDELLRAVRAGRMSRRGLLKRAAVLGLAAPAISALLAACGGGSNSSTTTGGTTTSGTGGTSTTGGTGAASTPAAKVPASPVFNPSAATPQASGATGQRGGKGELKLLYWQAPTIINPHLAQGTKDFQASRVCLEPLADFDANTKMVPFLATEIPSLDNGSVAKDGKSVTWKLRQGVTWHDGQPFTANDVKFTFDYVSDQATAATTYGSYVNVDSVDAVDDHTVKVNFKQPEPAWYQPFTGENGMILPQHIFKDYKGATARQAPANLKPIGTGPYQVTDFKPGDVVVYAINKNYWQDGAPHFDG